MKRLTLKLIVFVLLSGNLSCGDDDDGLAVSRPGLGTFELTITDSGREEVMVGEAVYKGSDRFINNTSRHKIDLLGDNDPDFIINVLVDADAGQLEEEAYTLARISPVTNVEPPVAEAYFIGSDTYKFVDNTGVVKINEITEEGIIGEFEVQIMNDLTGNFAQIAGTFYAKSS